MEDYGMRPKRYQYNIYSPDNLDSPIIALSEDTPLIDFNVGDKIIGDLENSKDPEEFKIVSRKHKLTLDHRADGSDTIHEIHIYTEREFRHPPIKRM